MCIYCFKMAEENEAACALSWNYLFIPSGRVSPVWKHFGYKKDSTGSLVKGPCTYCSIFLMSVTRKGASLLANQCGSTGSRQKLDTSRFKFLHSVDLNIQMYIHSLNASNLPKSSQSNLSLNPPMCAPKY